MNEKISIIIPIYNTGKYLKRCLDSVIYQTYKNLEIILVNDGSTDESSTICKEYVQKDNRILLIEQENCGAAAARNMGLRYTNGDYIGWVDSDDYIDLDMFEKMLDCIHAVKADACICQLYCHMNNKIRVNPNGAITYGKPWLNKDEYMEKLLPDKIKSYLPVHLIRRDLFADIQFPNGKIVEDAAMLPYIMEHSERIAILSSPKYHYMVRPGSETMLWQRKQKGRIARANIFIDRTDYSKIYKYNCFRVCLKIAVEYSNISYLSSLTLMKKMDKQADYFKCFMIRYQTEIKECSFLSKYKKYIADCIIHDRKFVLLLLKYLHCIKGIADK